MKDVIMSAWDSIIVGPLERAVGAVRRVLLVRVGRSSKGLGLTVRRVDHETVWEAFEGHAEVGLYASFPDVFDVDAIFVLQAHVCYPAGC